MIYTGKVIALITLSFLLWGAATAQATMQFDHFTQKEGLSSNYILSFAQDHQGFIWIGTENGLNRFDGQHVLQFQPSHNQEETLDDSWVSALFEDSKHQLWIGTRRGMHYLNRKTSEIVQIPLIVNDERVTAMIVAIDEDEAGNIWVLTNEKGLFRIKPEDQAGEHQIIDLPKEDTQTNVVFGDIIHVDSSALWISSTVGIYQIDLLTNQAVKFSFPQGKYPIKSDQFTATWTEKGKVLIVLKDELYQLETDAKVAQIEPLQWAIDKSLRLNYGVSVRILPAHSGRYLISAADQVLSVDLAKEHWESVKCTDHFGQDLFQEHIHAAFRDQRGNLWVGTAGGGVYLGRAKEPAFRLYQNQAGDDHSISGGPVRTFLEESDSRLQVGVLESGIDLFSFEQAGDSYQLRKEGTVPLVVESALSPAVIKLVRGTDRSIWMASNSGGLFQLDSLGQSISRHYTFSNRDTNTISGNRIWGLCTDKEGYIWVGTWNEGLNRIDPNSGEVTRFAHDAGDKNSLIHNNVRFVYCDSKNGLWVGTENGLDYLDENRAGFIHFRHKPDDPTSLSNNMVWAIFEDKAGMIWIGTDMGLNRLNRVSGLFERFFVQDGLPDNTIYGILEDDEGALWVSTENGLARQLPTNPAEGFYQFTFENGLPTTSFVPKAYLNSTASPLLLFGSSDGLLTVNPELLSWKSKRPRFAIHAVDRFSTSAVGGELLSDYFFEQEGETVHTTHKDLSITITLADLNWELSDAMRYEYQLKGLHKQWLPLNSEMKLSFANLKPKKYELLLRTKWISEEEPSVVSLLKLKVHPPWWNSSWAYFLYLVLGVGGIYQLLYNFLTRRLEQREANSLRKLDSLKNQLFANIAHEIRTPLTTIQGMIDLIEENSERWLTEGTQTIRRNSAELLDLSNQIMELHKMESARQEPDYHLGNIIPFLEEEVLRFKALAVSKNVQLVVSSDVSSLYMDFDPERTASVLKNLLSNAIKYTPQHGKVELQIEHWKEDERSVGPQVMLVVADTGPGIPATELHRIFDRFYRSESAQNTSAGMGIGLALTKALVDLMGGEIRVQSVLGQGTSFTVLLPISQNAEKVYAANNSKIPLTDTQDVNAGNEILGQPPTDKQSTILVVEDNTDLLRYLEASLNGHFKVQVARDGQHGIDIALETIPDLIVSDVMMPEKDGFTLCQELKQNERTSHIPILILTAKSDLHSRLTGLSLEADDYLAKPFSRQELLIRIQNLLTIRAKLQEHYQQLALDSANEARIRPGREDRFMLVLNQIIEDRYHDPSFDLNTLSQELNLSRSQLGRKIKALSGLSPAVYLRSYRLGQARILLKETNTTIKEIAFSVGFSNVSYFSQTYRNTFGETPKKTAEKRTMRK